ncbi:MAG: class I SAM-dependent methyltransferase [Lachnospiraceae bacterium]|nr:class I SAM-dependent methyltransferase [Lachnospiraceae bacterium]
MITKIMEIAKRPALYESGTMELWTDEHISKGMLECHINPETDAATRKHSTVQKIVKWIGTLAPGTEYRNLLDLGCGAGIFAEEFYHIGYNVTGMDFSERSITYARNSAREKNLPITFHHRDYLTMDFERQFDIITLIYYDFGVLSTKNRALLLEKIYTALKPNGILIFDIYTPYQYSERHEYKSWEYAESGFFSGKPHLCLNSFYRYDEQNTFCDQHIIITNHDVRYINIWEHTFTKDELSQNLSTAGFKIDNFYGDMAGCNYCEKNKELCVVARKG